MKISKKLSTPVRKVLIAYKEKEGFFAKFDNNILFYQRFSRPRAVMIKFWDEDDFIEEEQL